MTDIELATFCCAYLTGEQMLERAGLKAGERVLVTGASGGVGSAIVQLARARGAIPYAIVGPGKEQAVLDLGAEAVITRGVDDLIAAVDEATGGKPIDVVADLVGGPIFNDLLRILRPEGRYTTAGAIAGPVVQLDLRTMYLKQLAAARLRRRARAAISGASSATSSRARSSRWSAASTSSPTSTARRPISWPRISSASSWSCPITGGRRITLNALLNRLHEGDQYCYPPTGLACRQGRGLGYGVFLWEKNPRCRVFTNAEMTVGFRCNPCRHLRPYANSTSSDNPLSSPFAEGLEALMQSNTSRPGVVPRSRHRRPACRNGDAWVGRQPLEPILRCGV